MHKKEMYKLENMGQGSNHGYVLPSRVHCEQRITFQIKFFIWGGLSFKVMFNSEYVYADVSYTIFEFLP